MASADRHGVRRQLSGTCALQPLQKSVCSWMDWRGSRRGRRAGQQLVQLSEGLLRGGARYLEAELKEALVNGGSDRDGIDERAQLRGMQQTKEDGWTDG